MNNETTPTTSNMDTRRTLSMVIRKVANVALDYSYTLVDPNREDIFQDDKAFMDGLFCASEELCDLACSLRWGKEE